MAEARAEAAERRAEADRRSKEIAEQQLAAMLKAARESASAGRSSNSYWLTVCCFLFVVDCVFLMRLWLSSNARVVDACAIATTVLPKNSVCSFRFVCRFMV